MKAGLDGLWGYCLLQANGIDSHVVDAASISGRPALGDRGAVSPGSGLRRAEAASPRRPTSHR